MEKLSYQKANDLLQGRNKDSRKLANNTYLKREDGKIVVKLHKTNIITIEKDLHILNSGGWLTPTTKDRMNQFSYANIYQYKRKWIIHKIVPGGWISNNDYSMFYDGIKINSEGNVVSKLKFEDKKTDKLDNLINTYCKELKEMEKLPEPSTGDCWYCLMRVMRAKEGNTLGELTRSDHLLNHLKEKYIMGSLIYNALKERGYSKPEYTLALDVRDLIVRAVKRYFRKHLGLVVR